MPSSIARANNADFVALNRVVCGSELDLRPRCVVQQSGADDSIHIGIDVRDDRVDTLAQNRGERFGSIFIHGRASFWDRCYFLHRPAGDRNVR